MSYASLHLSTHIQTVLTLFPLSSGGTPSLWAMTWGEFGSRTLLSFHNMFVVEARVTPLFSRSVKGLLAPCCFSVTHFWVWWMWWVDAWELWGRSVGLFMWSSPLPVAKMWLCVCFPTFSCRASMCFFHARFYTCLCVCVFMIVNRTQEERMREEDQQTITVEVEVKRHDSEPAISAVQPSPETRWENDINTM